MLERFKNFFNPQISPHGTEPNSPRSSEQSLDIETEEQNTYNQYGKVKQTNVGSHPRDWTIGSTMTYRKSLNEPDAADEEEEQQEAGKENRERTPNQKYQIGRSLNICRKHHLKEYRKQGNKRTRLEEGEILANRISTREESYHITSEVAPSSDSYQCDGVYSPKRFL